MLGGWHPSLLPDQTLAAEYVDVVVSGQGEDAMLEVVQRLESGDRHGRHRRRRIQGGRQARFNTPRALQPIANCRPRPITWPISMPTNASADGAGRCTRRAWRVLTTARYCTNDGVYGRKWNALDAGAGRRGNDGSGDALRPVVAVDGRR